MKSQKGITLISLTIYVIVMALVIGVIAILSTFFYSNMKDINQTVDPITEYTKFNSFFSDEVNHENIKILECGVYEEGTENQQNYIVFDNGVQYTFVKKNKGIYRNQVKIAKEIEDCTFTRDVKNGKDVVEVKVTAGNKTRENAYTLKK